MWQNCIFFSKLRCVGVKMTGSFIADRCFIRSYGITASYFSLPLRAFQMSS